MAPIAGKYENISNENLVEYLVAIGTPADKAEKAVPHFKNLTITVDGNKVRISGEREGNLLIVGEEVDDPLPNGITARTTTQLSGDTLTLITKTPGGKTGTRVHQFSDSGFALTLSSDYHSVVAKLTYKRV